MDMCGRYTIFTDAAALEARFHAYVPPSLLAPSYNAAPSQGLPTILSANPCHHGERLGLSAGMGR